MIVIGIIIAVNFLSAQIFYRFDLTESKDYSLSAASRKTAGELDDVVSLKAYFTENLPSQYVNLRQDVGDVLDEYAAYSGGRIKYEFIDPKDDKELERELYLSGIPQLQFNVLEKDKYQIVKGYLGLVVHYGDKKEAIPVIQSTENLEYQITLAIKKVTGKIAAKVAFLASNGTADLENELGQAGKKLSEIYEVGMVDLKKDKEVPAGVNALIIAGPTEKFDEKELKALDKFITGGGALLFLADGVTIKKGLDSEANDLGLDGFFKNLGVKLNKDLVADVNSGVASFNQGFITFSTNYPLWPKVVKSGFDQNNGAVSRLESLVLPWVSSVEILKDQVGGAQYWELVKTTDSAERQVSAYDLNPQRPMGEAGVEKGRFILAAAVFGEFKSAYEKGVKGKGRLLVVGDSDFIKDRFISGVPDNMLFFQNAVDSLVLDEDLVNIRSKGVMEKPIKDLAENRKALVRYGNIFAATVAVIVFGLVRYYFRRKKKAGVAEN